GTTRRSSASPGAGTRAHVDGRPCASLAELTGTSWIARGQRAGTLGLTCRDSGSSVKPGLGLGRELAGRHADAIAFAYRLEQSEVKPVPAARSPRIKTVGVPQHGEAAPV